MKRNPNPPPLHLNELKTPDDLDVDIIMSKANVIQLTNKMRRKWLIKMDLFKEGSKQYLYYEKKIKRLDKSIKKGMINPKEIFDDNFILEYRNAIKNNGQEIFQAISSNGKVKIGFAIIVKNSRYDILPNLPFKY